MSQNATTVGSVSADGQFRWDGQQWVPITPGSREPTPWTRPMQLATAGLFALQAVYSVVVSFVFINHDTMLKAIKAQGTQIPAGTNVDTVVTVGLVFALGVVIFIAVLELVAAIGSFFGWRWMFWAALILFGLGSLGAVTNLSALTHPDTSPLPFWGVLVTELWAVVNVAMFVWLLLGAVRYGPWAMRKPGR